METCGAIFPFPYGFGAVENEAFPCNLEKGHEGDHVNRQAIGDKHPILYKTFARWPQSFPDPAKDSDELDEAMRDGFRANFPSVIAYQKEKLRERRERIATAAMQGIIASNTLVNITFAGIAVRAVMQADALIKELDKEK